MDLRNFAVTAQPNENPGVAIAAVTVEAQAYADDGATLLGDFTGANRIKFLLRVDGFTIQQHRQLVRSVAHQIIRMRLGVE